MKDFRINFGWGADSVAEQIAAQGLKIKKGFEDKVEYFESLRRAFFGMHIHGLITDAETKRIINRAVKKLATFVEE